MEEGGGVVAEGVVAFERVAAEPDCLRVAVKGL